MTKKNIAPILTVMVPVYNEERTLEKILLGVTTLSIQSYEVIVIDDSSTDGSAEIIKKFKKKSLSANVTFRTVRHKRNFGKGRAIRTALDLAQGTYFVVQDADLEYSPEDLPPILEHAIKNNYDVIYGSRFLGDISGMPWPNFMANHFYNSLLRLLYRTSITDMHTCYKMVKTDLFKALNMKSSGFEYAAELVSKLLRNGYVIHELPIRFDGRTKKEGKKIDIGDGIDCIVDLISYRFGKRPEINDK